MRKRKLKKKEDPDKTKSMDGYVLEQFVYCERFPDNKLSYGRIESFHPESSEGPLITIVDYVSNTYRIALMSKIIDEPTKQQISECQVAIAQRTGSKKKQK